MMRVTVHFRDGYAVAVDERAGADSEHHFEKLIDNLTLAQNVAQTILIDGVEHLPAEFRPQEPPYA